jgi:SacI homology domain
VYSIRDVQLLPLSPAAAKLSGRDAAAERRYRRLLTSGLDLSKDFIVSYSYDLCHTLQAHLARPPCRPFDSRFVWNEYLSQGLRRLVCAVAAGGDAVFVVSKD